MSGSAQERSPLLWASCLVTDPRDRLLVVAERQPHPWPVWNLPGGHVELGETPSQAACRELREEAGVRPRSARFVGAYASGVAIRFVYRATVDGAPTAGSDIAAVAWLTLEELLRCPDEQLDAPQQLRPVLELINRSPEPWPGGIVEGEG